MLSLRTTTCLSTLALLIGVAGTGWLSSLTGQWREPSDRVAMAGRLDAAPRTPPKVRRSHGPVPAAQQPRRVRLHEIADEGVAHAAVLVTPTMLRPLTTPAETSQSWDQLRGHLDGQVILRVQVDGVGRVESASVAGSSDDPILDQHALRSVRGWRFAVPPGHPDGLSGEVSMLFSSQGRGARML
ncbi:MAG: energy transducer TonB [Rhodanobacter sp.]